MINLFPHRAVPAGLLLCVVSPLLVGPTGTARAQDELPGQVRQALEQNGRALSPLTVTWRQERASDFPEAKVLSVMGLPATARDFLAPEKVRFQWQDGKFYSYTWAPTVQVGQDGKALTDKPPLVQELERSFDGRAWYNGNPNQIEGKVSGKPMIMIDTAEKLIKDDRAGRLYQANYLSYAGFDMPVSVQDLQSRPPQVVLLMDLDRGGRLGRVRTEDREGAAQLVAELVKDGRRQEFTFDPAMNYALRRRIIFDAAGAAQESTECRDFVCLSGPDHWLPRVIETAYYFPATGPKQPLFRQTIRVLEIDNKPIPPEQFVLVYRKPGSYVADATLPGATGREGGRIGYTVPTDPADLDRVIREATEGPQPYPWTRVILCVNGVLLGGFAVVLLWRFLARRSKTEG
jgi:hypothetical protein